MSGIFHSIKKTASIPKLLYQTRRKEMSRNHNSKRIIRVGLGMSIGLFFGCLLGVVAGNLVVFAGGGLILGLGIGLSKDNGINGISF